MATADGAVGNAVLAGAVLGGRYVLDCRTGGGHGAVWRATDTALGRPVAVRLLHPRYAGRDEAPARFKPANLLLASDGTVKITDFGLAHAMPRR